MALDIQQLLSALGNRLGGGGSPFKGDPRAAFSPFGGTTLRAESPFQGGLAAKSPFQGLGFNVQSPFAGQGFAVGRSPFAGQGFSPQGTVFGNPFGNLHIPNPFAPEPAPASPSSSGGGDFGDGGMDFSGPATADDNRGLTGQRIDNFIRSKFANSPLAGQGANILDIANHYGVSVAILLGIAWKESGMGTNVGAGNIFGITDPTRDQGLGGQRAFQSYGGPLAEVEAAAKNLASGTFKGKSAAEQIGAWYVGPQEYAARGLAATDRAGNGTVGDYLNNFIAPTYAALGIGYNQSAGGTPRAGARGGNIVTTARSLTGVPYQLGGRRANNGDPRRGVDCSEYTAWVWEQQGVKLSWNAQQQFNQTQRIDKSQLQVGDLVFFSGTNPSDPDPITHVGIYIGGGKMMNAQDGGVMEADLNSDYWRSHYAGAGRVRRA